MHKSRGLCFKTVILSITLSLLAQAALAQEASTSTMTEGSTNIQLAQLSPTAPTPQAFSSKSGGPPAQRDQKTDELGEIVVTAEKRAERLQDVPISMTVMTGKELDQSTFIGATDALNNVPGVTATANAGFGGGDTLLTIRGVGAAGSTFSGASPIAYYVDGVPFGFVKSATVPDPNVYDLQQIEVLRGPQSTLYGANAENGVVRVLTHEADLNDFDFKVRSTTSTTDGGGLNYGGGFAVNVPIIDGKLAVRGVVDYQDLSGWINSAVENHINDATLRNYRFKVNAQPTDELSIGLSLWSSRNNYGAWDDSTEGHETVARIPEPIATDFNAYGLTVGYQFPTFSIASTTSYIHYSNPVTTDLGVYGYLYGYPIFTKFVADTYAEELILTSAPASPWHWNVGAMFRDGTDKQLQTIPVLPITLDYQYGSESYAVFGEIGQRFFNDRFDWTLGGRYYHDDVSEKDLAPPPDAKLTEASASFHPITPRAVLSWYPDPDLTVYATFSEGFRSGFPQDLGVLRLAPGFPILQPDKLYNYELGAKAELWDRRLSLDTAVYYIDWRDVQQDSCVPIPGTGTGLCEAAVINAGTASGPGVDLAITIRPVESLQFGASVSWNDLRLKSNVFYASDVILYARGNRLTLSPEYTAAINAAYTIGIGGSGYKGQVALSGNYHSQQYSATVPATTVVNSYGESQIIARTELRLVSPDRWTAALFADNFTNSNRTELSGTGGNPELGTYPRPRTIGVRIDYSFR
jgi:iron complex outermembrane recepter protein